MPKPRWCAPRHESGVSGEGDLWGWARVAAKRYGFRHNGSESYGSPFFCFGSGRRTFAIPGLLGVKR